MTTLTKPRHYILSYVNLHCTHPLKIQYISCFYRVYSNGQHVYTRIALIMGSKALGITSLGKGLKMITFCHFLPSDASRSSQTWTLNLGKVGRVVYHCATSTGLQGDNRKTLQLQLPATKKLLHWRPKKVAQRLTTRTIFPRLSVQVWPLLLASEGRICQKMLH